MQCLCSVLQVLSLLLSNVIGNSLHYIASGPTSPDYSHPHQSIKLIESLDATDEIPPAIMSVLKKHSQDYAATCNISDCSHVQNVIVGSNDIAINAAASMASSLGYNPFIVSREVAGTAIEQGMIYSKLTDFICRSMGNWVGKDKISLGQEELDLVRSGITKSTMNEISTLACESINLGMPICLLGAGETVVRVEGSGIGGRCQELALSAAVHMDEVLYRCGMSDHFHIQLLCGDTDGQDGPSEAAGAVIDPSLCTEAAAQGLDPDLYLGNNDAFSFFAQFNQGKNLIMTGLTCTNVMDIHVILIHPTIGRYSTKMEPTR